MPVSRPTKEKRQAAAKTAAARARPFKEPIPEKDRPLTKQQKVFVAEYIVDRNGTAAAIRAGYSPKTARIQASQLLTKLNIQAAIEGELKAQIERTRMGADDVLRQLFLIAQADARELVQVKTSCCRYCYGHGHKYQRTVSEYNHDMEQFREKGGKPDKWDEQGGIGFNPHHPPHPLCPHCRGDGEARVVVNSTEALSMQGAAAYAGAEMTKHGLKVHIHSKMEAVDRLAKHFGLYKHEPQPIQDALASLLYAISGSNSSALGPVATDPEGKQHGHGHQPATGPTGFGLQADPSKLPEDDDD